MTHADLVLIAKRWLLQTKRCGFVLTEFHHLGVTAEIPDCVGFRIGYGRNDSVLVECKATRGDFLADARKSFRKNPEEGIGAYRFYLCPQGVIAPQDLPPGWGLVLVGNTARPRQVVGPKGDLPCGEGPFYFEERNVEGEWQMMATALRRLHISGEIESIYRPLAERQGK